MDHEKWLEQHDRMIADMNNTLRRAIRLGVQDGPQSLRSGIQLTPKILPQKVQEERIGKHLANPGGLAGPTGSEQEETLAGKPPGAMSSHPRRIESISEYCDSYF